MHGDRDQLQTTARLDALGGVRIAWRAKQFEIERITTAIFDDIDFLVRSEEHDVLQLLGSERSE